MSDLISRQDAIKKFVGLNMQVYEGDTCVGTRTWLTKEEIIYAIDEIPSIEPEERTAKVECKRYIGTSTGIVGEIKVTGICENCHNAVVDRYSFCPSCGARLEWE